ncbi:Rrf2 family transcriptional regulator [Longimicrobium terrae]|uniref:Rrf2 family protein n=1 Tax=Longimicrobium terrae TaxID=1639882 RepID=A0A841H3K7_9BACT|nr:Rrf2 family transcriptional regulator [Longimicrobium terrae]MBB4638374.1 Rrf2 family protein [Longimicrobium terrae]MBB6072558.1 Rrf2 family protein [Longimicrobium terrae]NNC28663.1 Rrf2 family transcriptional regulator [Longimicrobium terrae]
MSTISSRVAVAVHVLAFLAGKRGEAVTSETIAGSVNTNAVVVRRIVGALRNAGLVQVQAGVGGGAQLAREPGDITLLDVYRAVEEKEELFAVHQGSRSCCDIGGNIRSVLQRVFCRAHEAMQSQLSQTTIADVFRDVTGRAAACPGEPSFAVPAGAGREV